MVYISGAPNKVKIVCDTRDDLQRELKYLSGDMKLTVIEVEDKFLIIAENNK